MSESNKEVIEILKKVGVIMPDGHFVGSSGRHFDTYISKDFLFLHTKETSYICKLYAEKYKNENVEVVVGPALGGIILSQWVAYHLSEICGREVLSVFIEKTADDGLAFTRGYDKQVKGKRILIVEDNVTTGNSMFKLIQAIQDAGGNIVGACSMMRRSEELNSDLFKIPYDALATFHINWYPADDCPLCKAGVPINTQFGYGKKFLEGQEKEPKK